jgi:MFS family permease
LNFFSQVPSFFLAPLAGVFTDRWNRHRTIILTQSLAMVQAVAMAVLTLMNLINVWEVIALSTFLGLVSSLDMPARQAFLIEMVEDREALTSAIGLNSSMFNGARLVGPAIAGYLIAAVDGVWLCFLLNALSYVAVLTALLMMRISPRADTKPPQRVFHELKDGFRYAFGFQPMRALLLLLSVISLAATALTVLMPIFATTVLGGASGVYGLLTAAMGFGALGGALLLASRKTVLGLGRHIAWSGVGFGAGMIAFSFSSVLWLSMVLLAVVGFAMMLQTSASNTILQTIVDDDKRGRVMSFYTMCFLGMAPIGSLIAGVLASHIHAIHTMQIAGGVCIAASLVFARRLPVLRKIVRPIYQRMGILPEVTSGIPSVAEWAVEGTDGLWQGNGAKLKND